MLGSSAPGVCCLLTALLLAPTAAVAAWNWETVPIIGEEVDYETNPDNIIKDSPQEEDDAYISTTAITLKVSGASGRASATFEPQVRFRNSYANDSNSQLDGTDFLLPLSMTAATSRSQTSISGGYSQLPSREADYQVANPNEPLPPGGVGCDVDVGGRCRIDEDQSSWFIGPAFNYSLSPRLLLELSAQYSKTRYSEAELTNRFDYDYVYGTASLTRVLGLKHRVNVEINGSQYTADQPAGPLENDTSSAGLRLGYEYVLSSQTSLNASAGTSYSEYTISGRTNIGGLPCFDPSEEQFVLCETRGDDSNFVGELSLRQRLDESITAQLSISRSLQPNADGAQVVGDSANAYIQRDLSSRLQASAGISYIDQEAIGARTDEALRQRFDRSYARLELSLSWRFNPRWSVRGQYSYYADDQTARQVSGTASSTYDSSNQIFSVQISYTGRPFP